MLKWLARNFSGVLLEAGTVLHLARSGRLIVKASSQVRDGTFLVDEKGRRAGRVMETIGPVSSPYLSVEPSTERIERIVGTKLFISEINQREPPRSTSGRQFPRSGGNNNKKRSFHGYSSSHRNQRGEKRRA